MTREEAIEKVRQMSLPKETREILEALAPELRESEDERIRKIIIKHFEEIANRNEQSWITLDIPYILAYLERLKELDKMIIVSPEVWDNAIADAYENGKKEGEKQKPAAEEILVKAGLKPYKDGNQWCILAGDNIQEGICGFGDTIDEALYEFLKEILTMANSPQLKEQKPAEWSEEEYGRLFDIEHYLDGTLQLSPDRKIACIDFLKSLRPSWKPSEEQQEVNLEKFTEKMDAWKARYNYPDNIIVKGAMAFTARMFYMYPEVAREWYDSLPKVTQD